MRSSARCHGAKYDDASFSASLAQRLWGTDELRPTLEIEPRSPGATIPLSLSQLPMWFAEQLDPGTAASNAFEALRVRGAVDERALRFDLEEIVR